METARWLTVEGAYNVRDLGGYDTPDGGRTRWRAFLRADSLHELPRAAEHELVEYGVKTVVDLRRTRETFATPNVFADSRLARYVHLNMIGDVEPPGYGAPTAEGIGSAVWRSRSYQVLLDGRKDAIRGVLTLLGGGSDGVALFHCAGGTDRTGIIAALLLGLAGVEHGTIAEDYGLSAEGLRTRFLAEGIPDDFSEVSEADLTPTRARELLAPPDSMLLTLRYLDERYGGIESYARHIGLTDAQIDDIRDRILE